MDLVRYGKNVMHYRTLSTEKISTLRRNEWNELAENEQPILASTREGFDMYVNPLDNSISRQIWMRGLYFQEDVTRAFKRVLRRGDLVVDVGASVGWYAFIAAKRAARVVAFEPDPVSAGLIRKSILREGFENIELVEACVSDSAGEVTLSKSDSYNGDNSMVRQTGQRSIRVRSVTLDDSLPNGTIDVMKMDIQGAEPQAMAGAKGIINEGRVRCILLEWDPHYWTSQSRTLLSSFDAYDLDEKRLTELPAEKTDILLRVK
jgi:FkbM family methyltransferase